jgi:hypothetical protein
MSKLSTSYKDFDINKVAEMQEETGRLNRVLHWGFKELLEVGKMHNVNYDGKARHHTIKRQRYGQRKEKHH